MTKGMRIKKLREDLGYAQVDVSKMIGVSKQTLYKYENDIVTNIPSDKIEELARVLHTTPKYIMGWEDVPQYVSGTIELIDLYSRVTVEQRDAVLNLLRSFVNSANNN